MNADETRVFLKKLEFQLNKQLENQGYKAKIVPGRPSLLGPLISEQEIQISTRIGQLSIRVTNSDGGDFYIWMTTAPDHEMGKLFSTDGKQTLLVAARKLAAEVSEDIQATEAWLIRENDSASQNLEEQAEEDISFNSDFDYAYDDSDLGSYRDEELKENLEEERRQREAAEKSASNWKSLGVVLLVIFVIAAMSRCGGQTLPDNCEYIQDDRGGYTECT